MVTALILGILIMNVKLSLSLHFIEKVLQVENTINRNEDLELNFAERAEKYGYNAEKHIVVTEDGYIIQTFRINNRTCKQNKMPVLLMHGLLLSADSWLDAGPHNSLGYFLPDLCFDLWLGNYRGNYYARQHVNWNPDKDREFWKFSIDEMGYYDNPAHIDYILKHTNSSKLSYIGYSQGASSFLITASEKPEYNEKVNIAIALAPAAQLKHTKSVLLRLIADAKIDSLLSTFVSEEFFPKGRLTQEVAQSICKHGGISLELCRGSTYLLDSYHPNSYSDNTVNTLFAHFPAGTSAQTFVKYGQSLKSNGFKKYDYGVERNMVVYGSAVPPDFNLTNVVAPIVIMYGLNDHLVDPVDILWLAASLPRAILRQVNNTWWNHFDFPYSKLAPSLIFPIVKDYLLNNYSNETTRQ